jgi:hypothetical protein
MAFCQNREGVKTMGYTTYFSGEFTIDPPLKHEHMSFLTAFARTRHMARDEEKLRAAYAQRVADGKLTDHDRLRERCGLAINATTVLDTSYTNNTGSSVTDHNNPPGGVPGLWCKWTPTSDTTLAWDEGEKFYDYAEWLRYLLTTFLHPWGYKVTGTVEWTGENADDRGKLTVEADGRLRVFYMRATFVEDANA